MQKRFREFCVSLGFSLLAFGAWSPNSIATNIATCTLSGDLDSTNLGTSGSFQISAFSDQFRSLNPPSAPIGPNDTKSYTTTFGGVLTSRTPVAAGAIIVSTGTRATNNTFNLYGQTPPASTGNVTIPYGPTVSSGRTRKNLLSARGDFADVMSTSGNYNGEARAFVAQSGVRGMFATAYTNQNPPPGGSAAAEALDPFDVSSSIAIAYDPTISGDLELDSSMVSGAISAFAVDSSVFTSDDLDNYVDDGTPLNDTLWYLSIGTDKPTTDVNDTLVDFELNPLALKEIEFSSSFLGSIGTYTDADSESLLIDKAIDNEIGMELTLNSDEVDFSNISILPTDTMFAPMNGDVEYADDVGADINSVPAPASYCAGLALLCLLGVTTYRRKSSRWTRTNDLGSIA